MTDLKLFTITKNTDNALMIPKQVKIITNILKKLKSILETENSVVGESVARRPLNGKSIIHANY